MTAFLPADGATTRLHKLNHLAEFCAGFGTRGCTTAQLMKEGEYQGNTTERVLEYITKLVSWGVITRIADRYYVNELNYIEWAEAKGYRERTYPIKCQQKGCPCTYSNILESCPECGTPNHILNEPQGYTHIEIQSIPGETETSLTTEPNTHTHIKTPRPGRVKAGREADKRVIKFLSVYGDAQLGSGRSGNPDVFFSSKKARYAVEVKSVEHQVKQNGSEYKSSCVPLSRGQWVSLCSFADGNDFVPLLFVEVKIRGSKYGANYYAIPREMVDYRLGLTDSNSVRISVHDLPGLALQSYKKDMPIPGGFIL